MTARQLVDLVYSLCVENQDKEDVEKLDRTLEGPKEIRGPKTQADRMATILEMGGGIA